MNKKFLFVIMIFLLSAMSSWALNPVKGHELNPDSLHMNIQWKEQFIMNSDSSEVCVWKFIPEAKNRKNVTIIISYSDAGNMSKWMMPAVSLVLEGYDVYMYDYRGYGKSGYIYIEPLALYYDEFVKDLSSVVDLAKKDIPKNKLGFLSYSMGTIISNLYLYQHSADFAIYEGYIHNPVVISNHAYENHKVTLELPPTAYSYEQKSKAIKIPMLFFVGNQDLISLPFYTENFAKQRKNRLVKHYDGAHLQGFKTLSKDGYGDEYMATMIDFIKKNL